MTLGILTSQGIERLVGGNPYKIGAQQKPNT